MNSTRRLDPAGLDSVSMNSTRRLDPAAFGVSAQANAQRNAFGLEAESNSFDFHQLRQGFILLEQAGNLAD